MISDAIIQSIEKALKIKITHIEEINIGYSRKVYLLNNQYVLKMVLSEKKEADVLREITFLKTYSLPYAPHVLWMDKTRKVFPYTYYVETKLEGEPLLVRFPDLAEEEKKFVLEELLSILNHLHSLIPVVDERICLNILLGNYEEYINKAVQSHSLTREQLSYLMKLKGVIPTLFKDAKVGFIHGDLHFNNILIDDQLHLSLLDFEEATTFYLEKEYDPIYRMVRRPNSFIKGEKLTLDSKDFQTVPLFLEEQLSEKDASLFRARLLLFDCVNSLKWYYKYPEYDLYNEVLFQKSKILLK